MSQLARRCDEKSLEWEEKVIGDPDKVNSSNQHQHGIK
jgi:hypothetical protein